MTSAGFGVIELSWSQLALALLCDHLGDPQRALALTGPFMREVVAELDNAWLLTSADIEEALGRIGGGR